MTRREEQLKYCKICNNKGFDSKVGIICGLTNIKPVFINACEEFSENEDLVVKELKREKDKKSIDREINFYKSRIRPLLGIGVLLIIGFSMITSPYLMEDVVVEGRKMFLKGVLKAVWGRPAGVIAILGGMYYVSTYVKSLKSN